MEAFKLGKKHDPTVSYLKEMCFNCKDTGGLTVKGW